MPASHLTVDDDRLRAAKLQPLQRAKRLDRRIDYFEQVHRHSSQPAVMFAEIRSLRRGVDAALRVMDVLAPGFVEANRYVVPMRLERIQASPAEPPRSQETR